MFKHLLLALSGAILHCGLAAAQTLVPVPLTLDVPVSDIGTDNSIAESNTTRKLAVGADGTIYALFRSPTNGIRVARSSNRGASFAPSVQVDPTDAEAEIAIASDGDLHVVWSVGFSDVYHAVSRDGGTTFSTPVPVVVGSFNQSMHMAVDGDRVYLIGRTGDTVYRSADDGATFETTSTGNFAVFSDIFVDPLTHDVFVVTDNPSVYYLVSTDFGVTFTPPIPTGQTVYYSVGALSVTDSGRHLFFAGAFGNLERIAIDTQTYESTPVNATANLVTRSLSADVFGNVVSGYLDESTFDLKFEHSNDLAVTFGAPTTVVAAATRANAAINNINGDILFLYEKDSQIYLSTYEQGLVGYDVEVSPSALNFGAVEISFQGSLAVTLTNNGIDGVPVTDIGTTGEFTSTNDCAGTVPANDDCTITVTFAPTTVGPASGVLSMTLDGVVRQVSLNGTGDPAAVFTVTPTAGANGTIDPAVPQLVTRGGTTSFTFDPADDYRVDTVTGCGGTLVGGTYTTGPINADCTVNVTFEPADEDVVVIGKSKGGGGATEWWVLLLGVIALYGRRMLAFLAPMLLVAGAAQAAEAGQWYVGGAFNRVSGGQSAGDIAASLEREGFTADAIDVDDLERNGFRLFGGYRFTPNWSVEAGYTDLGDASAAALATVPVGEAEAFAQALLESMPASASGFEASASYRYPLNERFALAARAGFWRWENDLRVEFGDEVLNDSPTGTDLLFGVGFEWSPAPQWDVGFEASRYSVDSEDLDLLGANVKFNWR